MKKEDLMELIETIQTDNPGKQLALKFLKNYEGELTKDLAEMVVFFTGMLVNYDDLLVKAEAFETLAATRERHQEEINKLKDEILHISEEISPTTVSE